MLLLFRRSLVSLVTILALSGPLASPVAGVAQQAPAELQALHFRHIGPVGNRIAAVAGIAGDPLTYYVGAATGGIWKTEDGGLFWEPIFDDQPDHAQTTRSRRLKSVYRSPVSVHRATLDF